MDCCVQRVVVKGSESHWASVKSGDLQVSVLGHMLFNIFFKYTDKRKESILSKFASGTKVRVLLTHLKGGMSHRETWKSSRNAPIGILLG